MGDSPPEMDMEKVNELMGAPPRQETMGGVGPLDEFYGEELTNLKEWPHPRLLGGMQQNAPPAGGAPKKKFGIISCLVCWCCFPCGALTICYPLDEDKSGQ